jgi:hypothetical protein
MTGFVGSFEGRGRNTSVERKKLRTTDFSCAVPSAVPARILYVICLTLRAFAHTPAKPEPSPTPALDAM